jgi:YrbI family 3-deoxy-D-manno-octulosonate 8-phosphate phosphatase
MIRDNKLIEKKALDIKLLLVDFDGVLADKTFYLLENGEEMKKISSSDFLGVQRLKELTDIEIGLLGDDENPFIRHVASKMNVKAYYQHSEQKIMVLNKLLPDQNIEAHNIAFIGDEITDLQLMNRVGLSACPLDAAYEARNAADYVCNTCGGNGVIREFSDLLITIKQKHECLVD